MIKLFKENWKKITSRETDANENFWTWKLTPIRYGMSIEIRKLIEQYVKGNTLDIGAGNLLYKKRLLNKCSSYTSCDKYSNHSNIDDLFDIKKLGYKSNLFETVFCNQVLEHVDDTQQAIKEIKRVLKPNGVLILGTPFYFYLHSLPNDYFRFSNEGIKKILKDQKFKIIYQQSICGYFSALVEPLNILFSFCGLRLPIFQTLVNLINFCFLVIPFFYLDRLLKTNRFYPCIYFTVAKKNK